MRSDVFGIGKTILYLCCGRTDDQAVAECELPKGLSVIIHKCIAFSPKDRYSHVKHIYRDLSRLYNRKYRRASQKRKYCVGMLAAVLLSFSLGIAFDRSVLIGDRSRLEQKGTQGGAFEPATEWEEMPFTLEDTEQSLAEAANRISIDVSGYRAYVDRIVTCYYEMDIDGMGEAYDELFSELYAAEDLQAFEWTDASKLEEIPDNFPFRTYPNRLCDPLAYYDRILSTKIGHFEDYAGLIYNYLDFYLNEDTANPDMPFYIYCNGDATAREENYKEALVEVVFSAARAVMDQDGLEMLSM